MPILSDSASQVKYRLEVVYVLIDEFHDSDFCEVAVRFISDKPHRKNVAQRGRNQVGAFLNQQFQTIRKIFEGSSGIGNRHRLKFL